LSEAHLVFSRNAPEIHMNRPLIAALILSMTLAPGCKGLVKAAAKIAEKSQSKEETDDDSRRENVKPAKVSAKDDGPSLQEVMGMAKTKAANTVELQAAWVNFLVTPAAGRHDAELRLKRLVEANGDLPAAAQLYPAELVPVRLALATRAIGRDENFDAMAFTLRALADLDAAGTIHDAYEPGGGPGAHRTTSTSIASRSQEDALRMMGRFDMAFDRAKKRRNIEATTVIYEPVDHASFIELAALAGDTAAALDAEAFTKVPEGEPRAVAHAYRALAKVLSGDKLGALESIAFAEEAARALSSGKWRFLTLGKPFAGESAVAGCASRFHEAVRRSTYPDAAPNYLSGPLVGLRLCVLALPNEPPQPVGR